MTAIDLHKRLTLSFKFEEPRVRQYKQEMVEDCCTNVYFQYYLIMLRSIPLPYESLLRLYSKYLSPLSNQDFPISIVYLLYRLGKLSFIKTYMKIDFPAEFTIQEKGEREFQFWGKFLGKTNSAVGGRGQKALRVVSKPGNNYYYTYIYLCMGYKGGCKLYRRKFWKYNLSWGHTVSRQEPRLFTRKSKQEKNCFTMSVYWS